MVMDVAGLGRGRQRMRRFRVLIAALLLMLLVVSIGHLHRGGLQAPTESELSAARAFKGTVVGKRLLVMPELKTLFCPVPKVASSNWKVMFARFAGERILPRDLPGLHDREKTPLRYLSQMDDELVARAIHPRFGWFKFVFVRHPETRAVSGYLNKIRDGHRKYAEDPVKNQGYEAYIASLYSWSHVKEHNLREEDPPYFDEFLMAISNKLSQPGANPMDPNTLNEHWGLQARMCGMVGDAKEGIMKYDFVGRFENYEKDATNALTKMGKADEHFLTAKEVYFLPGDTAEAMKTLLNNSTRAMVREIYEEDFRVLAYQ